MSREKFYKKFTKKLFMGVDKSKPVNFVMCTVKDVIDSSLFDTPGLEDFFIYNEDYPTAEVYVVDKSFVNTWLGFILDNEYNYGEGRDLKLLEKEIKKDPGVYFDQAYEIICEELNSFYWDKENEIGIVVV